MRDSGTPREPLLICVLKAVRPAWEPMSRTHSCRSDTASTFTPYLHCSMSSLATPVEHGARD